MFISFTCMTQEERSEIISSFFEEYCMRPVKRDLPLKGSGCRISPAACLIVR